MKSGCLTTLLIVILSVLLLVSCSAEFAEDKLITGETGNGEVSRVELSSRKLIKNANLDVETKNFDTFQNTLDKTIDEFEGYVESRQITGDSGSSYRYGTVVARIPAQKLDEFISIVKDAGNVTRETVSTTDVTSTYIDMESRLKALNTEEQTLLGLLEKATNLGDILAIQSRLTDVRTEIEEYEAQKRFLDNSIDYSTVRIYVIEVDRITIGEEASVWKRIGDNLVQGFKNVWQLLKESFVYIISAIPYLLIMGVIAIIVLLIVRFVSKHQSKRFNNYNKGNGGAGGNAGTNGQNPPVN